MRLTRLRNWVRRMDESALAHGLVILLLCGLSILFGPILLALFGLGFYGWKRIGMERPESWARELMLGLGLGVLLFVLARLFVVPLSDALCAALKVKEGPSLSELLKNDVGAYVELMVMSVTTAGFLEEFIFRGYLLNRVADWIAAPRLRWVLATFLTSAVFGLQHFIGQAGGWRAVSFAFLMSLLLSGGYLLIRRRLWPVMVAHAFYDVTAITLAFIGWMPSLNRWVARLYGQA